MPSSPETLGRQQAPAQRHVANLNKQRDALDTLPAVRWDDQGSVVQPVPDQTMVFGELYSLPDQPKPPSLLTNILLAVALVAAIVLLFGAAPWLGDKQ